MSKSVGVILARLQPVHMGHLALISKSFSENDETYVFVGSADKFNERNPIPISLRMQLIYESFNELLEKADYNFDSSKETATLKYTSNRVELNDSAKGKKIVVVPLDDLTDESDNSHDWGFYLYSKIVTECESPNFTIYYSDGFEIITTWFPAFLLRNNVSLSLLSRNAIYSGVSATKIRKAILENDLKFLNENAPNSIVQHIDTLRNHIELSKLIK